MYNSSKKESPQPRDIDIKNGCYLKLLSNNEYNEIAKFIPKIYNLKIIDIFNKYKETNNGVILNENKILFGKKLLGKNGGKALNRQTADADLISELTSYCQNISIGSDNDENDIGKFISNNDSNAIIKNVRYALVKNFINSNKVVKSNEYIINYGPRYTYNNCQEIDQQADLIKSYECYDYNEEIVTAYEKNFFNNDNQQAITEFIQQQKNFIQGLGIREKRIIQDYTNDKSFSFYNKYKSSAPSNDAWYNYNKDFGDAFYIQVFELRLQTIIDNKNYYEWINGDRKNERAQSNINLSKDQWVQVLNKFMMDLDAIIMKAPSVKKPIYCYRGVTSHYIKGGEDADTSIFHSMEDIRNNTTHKMKSFVSTRLSSFSLDFNVSKDFLSNSTNDDRSLYRITILPLCKVLFVAQLSVFSNEVEIIAPSKSIFYYNIDINGNDLSPVVSNNNITKKYGICSPQDESFNSFDSILAFTPQPRDIDISYVRSILNDLNNNINESDDFLQQFIKICDFPGLE